MQKGLCIPFPPSAPAWSLKNPQVLAAATKQDDILGASTGIMKHSATIIDPLTNHLHIQAVRKWLRQQLLDADEESRTWRLRAIQAPDGAREMEGSQQGMRK